jgi:hypothetical protein
MSPGSSAWIELTWLCARADLGALFAESAAPYCDDNSSHRVVARRASVPANRKSQPPDTTNPDRMPAMTTGLIALVRLD